MEKLIYLWNIGSVNQISIKQEIRCFTNKSISWKPSFIIVRALNTNKPKIPQIYDKIMKLSLSTIWFILHFCRKCWEKHPWKSLTLALFWAYFFFSLKLNNLYIYIYQWKGNFMLIQLCKRTMLWKLLFFQIWRVERLLCYFS